VSVARPVGAILAGGGATRLGGARKGLLHVGGQRIVDRVAVALAPATSEILLVANDPDARGWLPDARVVGDVRAGCAALGGLHAALAHAAGAVLVVAWDMPFVSPVLLARLAEIGQAGAATLDAVVPAVRLATDVERPEPLCAYYAPSCLAAVDRRLDRGERRVAGFLAELRVHYLKGAELAAYGDPHVLFANVNTRDDLARATAHAEALA